MDRKNDFKAFGVIFLVMCEYFGVVNASEGLIEVYFELLKDLTIEEVKTACQRAMEVRIYNGLPKVGELKELLYGKREDLAALAYQKLVETMKRVGAWETVTFQDGAIGKAIEAMGGWEAVNEIPLDEWKFRRKEFESLYLANLSRRPGQVTCYGAFDMINGATGQIGWNKPVSIPSEIKPSIAGTGKEKVYQIEGSGEPNEREVDSTRRSTELNRISSGEKKRAKG